MGLKRTRKQRKFRGGFHTKARRGVLRNWWGNCDTLFKDDKRKKTRCLLDQQRSVWEAHAEDPSKIYENDARMMAVIKKIEKSKLTAEMKSALLHFIVNKTPVEEASANPIKTASNIQYDHLTEKQKKLYDEEEARRQFNLWHYDY